MPATHDSQTPIADAVNGIGLLYDLMIEEWRTGVVSRDVTRSQDTFSEAWTLAEELKNGNIPPHWRGDLFLRTSEIVAAFQRGLNTLEPINDTQVTVSDGRTQARLLARLVDPVTSTRVVQNVLAKINDWHLGNVLSRRVSQKAEKNPGIYGGAFAALANSWARAAGAIPSPESEAIEARFWATSKRQIQLQDGTFVPVAEIFRDLAPTVLLAGACASLREALELEDREAGIQQMVDASSKSGSSSRGRSGQGNSDIIQALDGVLYSLAESRELFASLGEITFAHEDAR